MSHSSPLPIPSERVLSTLNADGSRRWLRPRSSPGRFLHARRIVAWVLIGSFALLPCLKVGGAPAVLLDLGRRHFTLFGKTFLPTDTILLAVSLLGIVVTAFLVTALLGRVWCGWACPQTVYLEFLYRPLERFFEGPPGRGGTIGRKASGPRLLAKYLAYVVFSALLAHVFLSYFVGVERLQIWVRQSPIQHPTSFAVMLLTTGLMFANFAWFREQTCIVACPYGRLQSVLIDADSLIVSYDPRRGEPRKLRHARSDAKAQGKGGSLATSARVGDCVDCGLCVETCPTGIDIREGLRMECVGCAQCIDACDAVMSKLKRPVGLIRYSSQARIAGQSGKFVRPRLVAYILILCAIFGAFGILVARERTVDVAVLRGMGMPFTELPNGEVANPIRVKITNRTRERRVYRIEVAEGANARILNGSFPISVEPTASVTRELAVTVLASEFVNGKYKLGLNLIDDRQEVTAVSHELLGPRRAGRSRP